MNGSIGIFDSGLGGLTVLKTLAREFPAESFIYLGDIARLPYGNKSPETIRRYGEQVLGYLAKQDVKALIIACNSASSVFLGDRSFQGIPLLNVIEPGARAALVHATDKKVAVLGTTATIHSKAYSRILQTMDPAVFVLETACPLFVPLVEEGITGDEISRAVARRYLEQVKSSGIKTLILGCTHYPMLRDDLLQVLGSDTFLVESGQVLAEELKEMIKDGQLMGATGARSIRLLITDVTDHFERLARKFMEPEAIGKLEKIDL